MKQVHHRKAAMQSVRKIPHNFVCLDERPILVRQKRFVGLKMEEHRPRPKKWFDVFPSEFGKQTGMLADKPPFSASPL